MSTRRVEMVEYDCDGQCGAKASTSVNAGELPKGWVELRMSTLAASAVGQSGKEKVHFCSTCISLMFVILYNQDRQLRMLDSLTNTEIDDFDLEDLHEKLNEARKQKIAHDIKTGKL